MIPSTSCMHEPMVPCEYPFVRHKNGIHLSWTSYTHSTYQHSIASHQGLCFAQGEIDATVQLIHMHVWCMAKPISKYQTLQTQKPENYGKYSDPSKFWLSVWGKQKANNNWLFHSGADQCVAMLNSTRINTPANLKLMDLINHLFPNRW